MINKYTMSSCRSCHNNNGFASSTVFPGFQTFAACGRTIGDFPCGPTGPVCPGSVGTNYTIIGDTVAATLYAARLICNGVSGGNIFILTEGSDFDPNYNFELQRQTPETFITSTIQQANTVETSNLMHNTVYYERNPVVAANPDGFSPDQIPADALNPSNPQRRITLEAWRHVFATQIALPSSYRTYHTGKGPLGDFASAYIVPRAGPWWSTTNTSSNIQSRFFNTTTTFNLNDIEIQVYKTMRDLFCLSSVCLNLRANSPSIMLNPPEFTCEQIVGTGNAAVRRCTSPPSQGYQMTFVVPPNVASGSDLTTWCPQPVFTANYTRQLYQSVKAALSGNYRFGVTNIKITPLGAGGLGPYNVTYSVGNNTPITLLNTNVVWMTNHYDYLRLAGNSSNSNTAIAFRPYQVNNSSAVIRVPSVYRSVLTIPKVNCITGFDFTQFPISGKVGDGVTTYINFTLSDVPSAPGATSQPNWFVQAYTTDIDTYPVVVENVGGQGATQNLPPGTAPLGVVVPPGGVVPPPGGPDIQASSNATLLIIEAIHTPTAASAGSTNAGQRTAYYQTAGNQRGVHVIFGDPIEEAISVQNFTIIAANILFAYTGQDFTSVEQITEFFFSQVKTDPVPVDSANPFIPSSVAALTSTRLPRETTLSTVMQTGSWLYGNFPYVPMCPWNSTGACANGGCQEPQTIPAGLAGLFAPVIPGTPSVVTPGLVTTGNGVAVTNGLSGNGVAGSGFLR